MAVDVIVPNSDIEVASNAWQVGVESSSFSVGIESEMYGVDMETGVIVGGIPYTGSYEVTPRVSEQIMPTRMRTLSDDMTVHAIPYTRTTNIAGGYTAIIGG